MPFSFTHPRNKLSFVTLMAVMATFSAGITGCNAPDDSANVLGATATDTRTGHGTSEEAPLTDAPSNVVGKSCEGGPEGTMCLAVTYVTYNRADGSPIVSEAVAVDNIAKINRVWNQCKIGFQIEKYAAVDARDYQLDPGTGAQFELDRVRSTFSDDHTLLVATTGNWNTTKNAWTAMPGSGVYGAVMEGKVGDFANIIAHELGHYLGLDHVGDGSNVMNSIIAENSTAVYSSQCQQARNVIEDYWGRMLR